MTKSNIDQFLNRNSLAIIVYVITIVSIVAVALARVNYLEAKVNSYPSKDYFELKFQDIDKALAGLEKKLDSHIDK